MSDTKLLEERLNLRTALSAAFFLLLSLVLFYLASIDSMWTEHETLKLVMQQIASSLFTLAALTLAWELIAKRAFLEEILAKTRIAKDLLYSGITQITDSFHEEVDWSSLFQDASKIDIFFAYGDSWRKRHDQKLKDFVGRENSRLRVVLPDHRAAPIVEQMAIRFSMKPERLITYITEAETFFLSLRETCGKGSTVEIRRMSASPLFTFYRFDGKLVFTVYSHRQERCAVPTFVCESRGTIFDFFYEEFRAMVRDDNPLAEAVRD